MDNLPYSVTCDELPDKFTIEFSGQLIINYIEKITEQVRKSIVANKNLEIIIKNPDSLDMTFIQLLMAIKVTLKASNSEVIINSELKEELKTLISNSGFNYVLN